MCRSRFRKFPSPKGSCHRAPVGSTTLTTGVISGFKPSAPAKTVRSTQRFQQMLDQPGNSVGASINRMMIGINSQILAPPRSVGVVSPSRQTANGCSHYSIRTFAAEHSRDESYCRTSNADQDADFERHCVYSVMKGASRRKRPSRTSATIRAPRLAIYYKSDGTEIAFGRS